MMKQVLNARYLKIAAVPDNLNPHTPSTFLETFASEEARCLMECFEFHFIPKHGSWLNRVGIELSNASTTMPRSARSGPQTLTKVVRARQHHNDEVVKIL